MSDTDHIYAGNCRNVMRPTHGTSRSLAQSKSHGLMRKSARQLRAKIAPSQTLVLRVGAMALGLYFRHRMARVHSQSHYPPYRFNPNGTSWRLDVFPEVVVAPH